MCKGRRRDCLAAALTLHWRVIHALLAFAFYGVRFLSSARCRSRGAKPSPLARNYGGVARDGGQRSTVKLFSLRKLLPLRRGTSRGASCSPLRASPRMTGSIASNPKTEGRGFEKSNPSLEIRNSPALFRRFAGVGGKGGSGRKRKKSAIFEKITFPCPRQIAGFRARRDFFAIWEWHRAEKKRKCPSGKEAIYRKRGGAGREGKKRRLRLPAKRCLPTRAAPPNFRARGEGFAPRERHRAEG